ncbi:MAG: hypothetical protein JWP92_3651 [Caulobacter sp.]|nr:hypothetical protein [Caulobacter sp.]
MIRNLTLIAGASFILALACFAGAAAIGGRDLMQNGWTMPVDWQYRVTTDHGRRVSHVTPLTEEAAETASRTLTWVGARDIEIDLPAEVSFTQGDQPSVVLTGPRSVINRIKVAGGRFYLEGEPTQTLTIDRGGVRLLDDTDRLRIEIVGPAARVFTINGGGDLEIDGYDQPDLALTVNGGGDVRARGKTTKLDMRIAGSGTADLSELPTRDADVTVSGSGDARVAPSGVTRIKVAGSGDVTLLTKPASLTSDVAGSGAVHEDW